MVKIDPKSIGVGQYQHDVSQNSLKKSLEEVVESAVNFVGADLNTASTNLLAHISGIGPALSQNIVKYRNENGLFRDLKDLTKVERFTDKTFELSSGFLRVFDGDSLLDSTGIHPERYGAVTDMAKESGQSVKELIQGGYKKLIDQKDKWSNLVGEFTFDDILNELSKPGRDPRDPYQVFEFRNDIHNMKDLSEGMVCPGIVTNVTNFGAFVDIGVHQDGLVHLSQLVHDFVDDPKKVVSPGDQVKVKVLKADLDKKQLSLSMLLTEKPKSKVKAKPKTDQTKRKASSKKFDKKGKGPGKGGPKGKGKAPARPRREKPAFNNPFAGLADLKK